MSWSNTGVERYGATALSARRLRVGPEEHRQLQALGDARGAVFERLREINRAGVTTVLVEQNVRAALAIADRAAILVEGRIAHEGPAAALAEDAIVAELYLGARRAVAAP